AACRLTARGVDQVGDGFRLRKVESALEKCATREFPGLSEPCSRIEAGSEQRLHHDRAAVAMKFEHILARIRIRGGEVNHEALVDRLALSFAEVREFGPPRLWQPACQRLSDTARLRSGDADDADASASRRSRDGGYCVAT